MRNRLLHEGDWSIAKNPFMKNEKLFCLENLAQKYVGYVLYGGNKYEPFAESNKTTIGVRTNLIGQSEIV